ncbi:MAG: GGDEF domain-containing protein [Gemmatimonadaceae bacterium]|nr:GGDEF domain-containing protein [Gemmatimonadaceae bacterium]
MTATAGQERRGAAATWLAGAIGVTTFLGYLDYVTGYELGFDSLYLFAVAAAAWKAGRWAGVSVALYAVVAWTVADVLDRHVWGSGFAIYWNGAFRAAMFVVMAWLVSELRQALARESELARTDFLTGAMNSRAFHERAADEISRSRRYGHPLTAAFVDLDDFKQVNDERGHSEGDRALRVVVRALRDNLRDTDSIARVGGDEFVVLLPETDSDAAQRVVAKLYAVLHAATRDHACPVTASMGVVTFRTPPESPDELLRVADAAMYGVKRTDKNRIAYQIREA